MFFMNNVRAGDGIPLQYLICLIINKNENRYSRYKKCKVTFGLKYRVLG